MAVSVRTKCSGQTVQVTVELELKAGSSMMEYEEQIQEGLNHAGCELTRQCLQQFDTDGSPIVIGGIGFTTKGQIEKEYQSGYGVFRLARHVYQTGWGGATFCPMDQDGRVINSTTPKFARMAAFKYAVLNSSLAQKDLAENHGRQVSRCYLQDNAQAVAAIVKEKEQKWSYAERPLPGHVHSVGVGVDGTCVLFCEQGYRQPMVGTISLYNILGERLHTIYVAAAPEKGKSRFYAKMEREMAQVKARYPWATWVGLADGAHDHWSWLERHTDAQGVDFWHTASYVEGAAAAMAPKRANREAWVEATAHDLKHRRGAAQRLLHEMNAVQARGTLRGAAREDLHRAISYFQTHHHRMNYSTFRCQHWPIGSGVTEAACKTVVKERMSGSGMKWTLSGAETVLQLRPLILTVGRWDQFWQKISRLGS